MKAKARVFKTVNNLGEQTKHVIYAEKFKGEIIWCYVRVWLTTKPVYGDVVRKFWDKYLMTEQISFKDETLIAFFNSCNHIQQEINNKTYFL